MKILQMLKSQHYFNDNIYTEILYLVNGLREDLTYKWIIS